MSVILIILIIIIFDDLLYNTNIITETYCLATQKCTEIVQELFNLAP